MRDLAFSSNRLLIAGALLAAASLHPARAVAQAHGDQPSVAVILEHAIDGIPGRQFSVVRVQYAPGEAGVPHHHTAPLVAYIVSGALRSAVGDGPEHIYHAGESFYEPANALHRVSANASTTEPVTFIAVFVAPPNIPLTVKQGK